MRRLLAVVSIFISSIGLSLAQREDGTLCSYLFTQVNHDFPSGMYLKGYLELDQFAFRRIDCAYLRLSVGTKVFSWLSAGVNYIPLVEPQGRWHHFSEADLLGAFRLGNFKLSLRERYRHGFTSGSNELRSRLKVAYGIPGTRLGVYMAPEFFTWDRWKKTRYYLAATCDVTENVQFEAYYMLYDYRTRPTEHIIGLGVNFDL